MKVFKKTRWGLLVFTLVFGLVLASCGGSDGTSSPPDITNIGNNPGVTNPSGTGPDHSNPGNSGVASPLNGIWVSTYTTGAHNEWHFNNGDFEAFTGGLREARGTYTTSGSSITLTITHLQGEIGVSGLQSRWYSVEELRAMGLIPPGGTEQTVWQYSISGNTLTFTGDGLSWTYARRNSGNNDPNGSGSETESSNFTVTNEAEWNNAVSAINSNGDGVYTITIANDFSVAGRTPYNGYTFDQINFTITIRGSRTISLSSPGHLLRIGEYYNGIQNIIVEDTRFRGININDYPVVYIGYGSSFTMQGTSSIHNNNNYGTTYSTHYGMGGGVYVSGGTFTMRDNASIHSNTATNGGGVNIGYGTFIMQDSAAVFNNTAGFTVGSPSHLVVGGGGGVEVSGGTFTMRDNASVHGNTTNGSGGGVSVWRGTFNMLSGTILGNTAEICGGGVNLDVDSTFIKTGGTIYGYNESINSNISHDDSGHAVYSFRRWRNSTSGPSMNTNTHGFWEYLE